MSLNKERLIWAGMGLFALVAVGLWKVHLEAAAESEAQYRECLGDHLRQGVPAPIAFELLNRCREIAGLPKVDWKIDE